MSYINNPKFKQIDYIVPELSISVYSGYTNQPDGDGIEVVSDSASDTGYLTLFGTVKTSGLLTHETITLDGTTAVSTTETDWDDLYGYVLGKADGTEIVAAVGTITIREASANQTITTATAGDTNDGMLAFYLHNKQFTINVTSGSVWLNIGTTAPTTAKGFEYSANYADDILGNGYVTFLTDATGATAQFKFYKE